ncbi:MAG: 1-acyl-sn-glycerol-3-phosphate acyltransferase [Endomicrobia bacterium]|nr:1-acyl-sn-glycerol-3-phosphate acyltransferase [Endomicrobiia bacterium]
MKVYIKIIFKNYFWDDYVKYSYDIIRLVRRFNTKFCIEGENYLKEISKSVVVVSNHMSSLETFIFGYVLGRYFKISFVIKESLLKYPIFGRILKFLEPISVTRKNPREDFIRVINGFRKLLNNKISIVVFPQTTRSKSLDVMKFSSISTKLAKIFNVDILPVCVKTDFLDNGKIIKDFGNINPGRDVYIKIFPPITFDKVNRFTDDFILDMFKKTLQGWGV